MRTVTTTFSVMLGLLMVAGSAAAQQAPQPITNPTPGCTATPAQIEQVRQAGIAFTRSQGAERVALADPSYKQHNPAFVKGAREAGMSDYDYFKARFGGPPAARAGGLWRAWRRERGTSAASRQPHGDRHGRVRSRDGHPQDQPPPGSDGGARHVLRSVHVRHVPRAATASSLSTGNRRRDQPCQLPPAAAAIRAHVGYGIAGLGIRRPAHPPVHRPGLRTDPERSLSPARVPSATNPGYNA